jgi:site-specific recombinase XerD
MTSSIAYLDESIVSGWERSLYAFLAEKQRRSGSIRTVQSYSRMLQDFFGRAGKTPDQVTSQDVFAWAYGVGLSGKQPGSITIGARIACLSSFYRFLIRMKVVPANPCDAIERPRASQCTPRGLNGKQISNLLQAIPDTPVGLRDRAITLTLTFTGRRRAEVLGMTAGSITFEGGAIFYSYGGKGGKSGKRELPRPAFEAIQAWLARIGQELTAMRPEATLWPDTRTGRGITSGTFYRNLQCYLKKAGLPAGGVHIFRHSAVKLRRDAGESVEEISRFLDHSSLAVTTTYLRRLEGRRTGAGRRWLRR